MKKLATRWKIPAKLRQIMPDVSGDAINGVGETVKRRPSVVYWAEEPASIPHGPVIDYMARISAKQTPSVSAVYKNKAKRAPPEAGPVAAMKVKDTPENWSLKVKEFALNDEADLVGIVRLNPLWFFKDKIVPDLPWAIVLGAKMDYAKMQHCPSTPVDPVSGIEVAEVYNQVDRVAGRLANWIRKQGFAAEHQGGPDAGSQVLIPAAIKAGFGELGKHGSLINRKYGSLIRLSLVRTKLPLVEDAPDKFGADEFCTRCQVCTRECPVDAITNDKRMVRGVTKWSVIFDKCLPFFTEHNGCAICITVCPWSRPEVAPRLAEKCTRRFLSSDEN